MNRRTRTAFTLVELLVAVALIGLIVSMVQASYAAAARSSHSLQTRAEVHREMRPLIDAIAAVIRCAYLRPDEPEQDLPTAAGRRPGAGGLDIHPDDTALLRVLTTRPLLADPHPGEGLFDVALRFEPGTGTLYASQGRTIGPAARPQRRPPWVILATGIDSVQVERLDRSADYPPQVVRITLGARDRSGRLRRYQVAVHPCCLLEPEVLP